MKCRVSSADTQNKACVQQHSQQLLPHQLPLTWPHPFLIALDTYPNLHPRQIVLDSQRWRRLPRHFVIEQLELARDVLEVELKNNHI
jgi:hypothetical protein